LTQVLLNSDIATARIEVKECDLICSFGARRSLQHIDFNKMILMTDGVSIRQKSDYVWEFKADKKLQPCGFQDSNYRQILQKFKQR
jgi:hypothetical protein